MFKKALIFVCLAQLALGFAAQAQDPGPSVAPGKPVVGDATLERAPASIPQIVAFTGEFAAGEKGQLSGLRFGSRGLLTTRPGLVSRDDGLARVVLLGDAPTFANCRLLHQLKTTDWAQGTIDLEFSFPDITPGTDMYLFVLDAKGTPSNGLGPLVEGVGIAEGPGRPGPPRVE
ncbi:MAG: hypothetical protein QNL91_09930 [Candidatus Krumholzibacteria bacterium]|nr:hypothetical protein [Candidatus Krumholzibacteria bacterium]